MNTRLLYKSGIMTAKLSGDIDHHNAAEIREAIDDSSQKLKPYCLRIDFEDVPFMDSSGIGLILGRIRLYNIWGGKVVLCGLSPYIQKMVELSGISELAAIERRAS